MIFKFVYFWDVIFQLFIFGVDISDVYFTGDISGVYFQGKGGGYIRCIIFSDNNPGVYFWW